MIAIEREQIATMIPHAGAMCLLDRVLSWDGVSVHCLSRCHRHADNPLRRLDGALGAVCGVEIAAQAMAVHGRLLGAIGDRPAYGYLASVRDLRLGMPRLDGIADDLIVQVVRLMGDDRGATYRFELTSGGVALVSGRATVLFDATV